MSQLSRCKLTRVRKTVEETVWKDVLTTICRSDSSTTCRLLSLDPGPSSSRSSFFMKSSQLYAAALTHYSTEPLTTGPNYDPPLLLLALAGDVHPNPGPSRYPCSVCFKNVTSHGTSYLCTRCSHWVHSRCFFETLRIIVNQWLDLYRLYDATTTTSTYTTA